MRAFCGQHAHVMVLWEGGLYKAGAMLSLPHRDSAILHMKELWFGMMAIEDFLANPQAGYETLQHDVGVFYKKYLWKHSQLQREFLTSGANVGFVWVLWEPVAQLVVIKLASGLSTEQPAENLFKGWRRLVKKRI